MQSNDPGRSAAVTIVSLSSVSVSFGAEDILTDIGCAINADDRIGLVGRNGAGKTTLLRVIEGSEQMTAGQRHVARSTTIHLVAQLPAQYAAGTILDEAREVFAEVIAVERALQETAAAIATGSAEAAATYSDLEERFRTLEGFAYENRLEEVLTGLGFRKGDWDVLPIPASDFSTECSAD